MIKVSKGRIPKALDDFANFIGLAPRMDVLSWGRRDFQISFSNRDTSRNAWNLHWESFMVDTGILSNNMKFPLTNVKWHSVTWPYTMTTPYWSDFVPNYRILSGFHGKFATGVACRQGTLTPPDTWSRPFGTCICSTCWDQSFSELVVILPDYALWISLGTFSILHCIVPVRALYVCVLFSISDDFSLFWNIPSRPYRFFLQLLNTRK